MRVVPVLHIHRLEPARTVRAIISVSTTSPVNIVVEPVAPCGFRRSTRCIEKYAAPRLETGVDHRLASGLRMQGKHIKTRHQLLSHA